MNSLCVRLLASIVVFPLASAVNSLGFSALFVASSRDWRTLAVRCLGIALAYGCWFGIWFSHVRWTSRRKGATFVLLIGCLGTGILFAYLMQIVGMAGRGASTFWSTNFVLNCVFNAGAPIWMLGTALLWRETKAERMKRLAAGSGAGLAEALRCPSCGYSMRGLMQARCPECGSTYTLEALVTANTEAARQDGGLTD